MKITRDIQRHLHGMYDEIMGTLVKTKPDWFAPPNNNNGGGIAAVDDGNGWAYSYEKIQWAFSMVISRHHYLPIRELDDATAAAAPPRTKKTITRAGGSPSKNQVMHETAPPANQPTDQWIDEAHNEERVREEEEEEDDVIVGMTNDDDIMAIEGPVPIKHSFLAPLADMINFGPPCLTGQYNAVEHVFEFVATCPFVRGQEVTFWYSSDCSDVIIANFGFVHPLVPPCGATEEEEEEDWETKKNDEWVEQKEWLEAELREAYGKVDLLRESLSALERRVISCGCDGGENKRAVSMPVVAGEPTHKLRKNGHHHALRQEGWTQEPDQQQTTSYQQIEEELG
jgi:hypothetical protein